MRPACPCCGGRAGIAAIPEPTLMSATELLRRTNYRSTLIKDYATYPADMERALSGDYSSDPAKRDLQLEALAHIEAQKLVDERIAADAHLNVCDLEFLRTLYKAFYDRLPESMHVVRSPDGRVEEHVIGGDLRSFDVVVGKQNPPTHDVVARLMVRSLYCVIPALIA